MAFDGGINISDAVAFIFARDKLNEGTDNSAVAAAVAAVIV